MLFWTFIFFSYSLWIVCLPSVFRFLFFFFKSLNAVSTCGSWGVLKINDDTKSENCFGIFFQNKTIISQTMCDRPYQIMFSLKWNINTDCLHRSLFHFDVHNSQSSGGNRIRDGGSFEVFTNKIPIAGWWRSSTKRVWYSIYYKQI